MQPNTLEVLKARYFLRDKEGKTIEDWEGLCRRTASRAADGVLNNGDKKRSINPEWGELVDQFIHVQFNQEFIANSPVYFNVGTKREMGSACFIIPVGDSIADIYQAVKNGAMVEKLGGGIGMDFSQLRPTNTITSVGGKASGAISFMTAFDTMTQTIKQGGKRRGAMMATLDVTHPEILSFIDCKQKTPTERVTFLTEKYGISTQQAEEVLKDLEWRAPFSNFNITVKIPNKFMEMQKEEGHPWYMLLTPGEYTTPYRGPLIDPRAGAAVSRGAKEELFLDAKEVLDRIIEKAWQSGEPGIGFIDRINEDNPVASISPIYNPNPCGEYWQIPFSSCNLGSINLSKFFLDKVHPDECVDYKHLAEVTGQAVRFLEGILTINDYPIPEVTDITKSTRPIGLGVMGFADLLLKAKVRYGSKDSIHLAEDIMLWINYHAWRESARLANEKGPFTQYQDNRTFFDKKFAKLHADFTDRFGPTPDSLPELVEGCGGVRHCQVTTIAPTGTISLFAECSSGIEPVFAYELKRQDTISTREYTHWFMEQWESGHKGQPLPDYAVEAHDVTPREHILIQAAFQKYCDNAVSKTINLPETATKDDVRTAYLMAFDHGLKSVTVYRDGCREGVLLHSKPKAKPTTEIVEVKRTPLDANGNYMHRPEFLPGATWKVKAPAGTVYVTVNYSPEEKRIVEVFVRENSGNEAWELAGRLLSVILRSGTSTKQVMKQLLRTRGQSTIVLDGQILTSVAQAIAVLLEKAEMYFASPVLPLTETMEEGDIIIEGPVEITPNKMAVRDVTKFLEQHCPDCGSRTLYKTEGCTKCIRAKCGYTKCGG